MVDELTKLGMDEEDLKTDKPKLKINNEETYK